MSQHRNPAADRCPEAALIVRPANTIDIPRFHLSQPLADGSVLVTDRVLMNRLLLYVAKSKRQFDGGHRPQLWYVRLAGDLGAEPVSRPYGTFEEAAQAARDGTWNQVTSEADCRPVRIEGMKRVSQK